MRRAIYILLLVVVYGCTGGTGGVGERPPPGSLPSKKALAIAREVCEQEGWPWRDPAIVFVQGRWRVGTPGGQLGSNAIIEIDPKTGDVLRKDWVSH